MGRLQQRIWPAAALFGVGWLVTFGWVPEVLGRAVPFADPVLHLLASHETAVAFVTTLLLYTAHVLTVSAYRTEIRTKPAPYGFLAVLVLQAWVMIDGCVALVDPLVALPHHRMLAQACAVGNAAMFAHLCCDPV